MSRRNTFFAGAALLTAFGGYLAHEPVRQFLFAPEGLSLAPANICLDNKSGRDVVVTLAVEGGEKAIALLANGERECAASPQTGRAALIRIGVTERAAEACEIASVAGREHTLEVFSPPADCKIAG